MNLLAKHEVGHIAFCCDDRADTCGRHIGELYVEIDFDKREAVVTQQRFGGGEEEILCKPMDTIWYNDGNAKHIWVFSLDEKS